MEFNKEILKAISQAQEGKEEAFNKIYSYTYNFVYFRAKSIMKNDDEAWDLLQEVYIVAYKSISKLEKPENLYAWLGGIVYNLGMKAYRKKKDVLLDEESEGIFETIRSTDKDIQPEEYIEEKQTNTIVKELIDQLPELQKVAVIAYYFDEMSVKDIADQFECSEGTIKSRLNYARQFLKKAVEDKERKDGIKLHSITIPTIIVALRMLSEDTTVSAQAAQLAYNGVCSSLGLEATSINIGANLGSGALSGTQAAGTATKATGIVAKFMGMTTGAQVLTVSLVTVISVSSILGGIALTNSINKESKTAINFSSPIDEVPVEPSIAPTVQTETETVTETETENENVIDKPIELSEEEKQEMSNTVPIEANSNITVNELMQNHLKEHVTDVSEKYSNYDYSEYFIYDWNKQSTPILIIRDVLNNDEKSSIYSDLHYIESKNHLENYGQSISGAWDSIFYKKDYSFIVVIDDNFDESESHAAYFYGDGDLKGFDTMAEAEELWFWYKNNGITAFLDLDTYKSKREEVEQLEKITWYKSDDLTPFR